MQKMYKVIVRSGRVVVKSVSEGGIDRVRRDNDMRDRRGCPVRE